MKVISAAEYYTRSDGCQGRITRVLESGKFDTEPIHKGYNSRCSSCWLGYPHSEAVHRVQVNRWKD